MSHAPASTVVREFWRLMATNDFASVAAVLAGRADRAHLVEAMS
jgi:hypothetical protein